MSNEKTSGDMYVYSTLASPQRYVNYSAGPGDLPIPKGEGVLIHGGANVAQRKTLITPRGVATPVSAADLAYLMENPIFKLHQQNGFVLVEPRSIDPERAAGDMNSADPSRQLSDGDFEIEATDEDGHAAEPIPATAKPKRSASPAKKRTR
jgi:hypothetical protein